MHVFPCYHPNNKKKLYLCVSLFVDCFSTSGYATTHNISRKQDQFLKWWYCSCKCLSRHFDRKRERSLGWKIELWKTRSKGFACQLTTTYMENADFFRHQWINELGWRNSTIQLDIYTRGLCRPGLSRSQRRTCTFSFCAWLLIHPHTLVTRLTFYENQEKIKAFHEWPPFPYVRTDIPILPTYYHTLLQD